MAFDFTPPFTHGNLSENFSNANFVQALNDEYNNNTEEWEYRLLQPYKPSSSVVGSLWPAGITYATWLLNQYPGCNSAGCSSDNPFSIPLSDLQKKDFLGIIGSDCDTKSIFNSYSGNRAILDFVENTYYNLANPDRSFTWENGSICIQDRYNFEGIGDFGGASALTLIVGAILAIPGTSQVIMRKILEALSFDYDEESDPFTINRRGDQQIAEASVIFLKNCFTPEEICEHNNDLYRCAVRSKKINLLDNSPCFNGDSCIEVGQAQPSPILGFPSYAPNVMEITTNEASLSFGNNSNYPSPFTSFNQQLVNANNYLGAYAMLGNLSGRLIIIPSGTYIGELGFTCQNWYNFNDGSYARDANGDLYPSKSLWWDTCLKSEMTVRLLPFESRPLGKVMVATKSFSDNNSPEVFGADYPINTAPIESVNLINILTALPAATLSLI